MITSREAMHIVAPALKAAGVDIIQCHYQAVPYRARKTVRKSVVQTQREKFVPNTPLVAHLDGKILPDSDGRGVDRLNAHRCVWIER